MSKRQPTIELNNQIIAHDEIVAVIELQPEFEPNEDYVRFRTAVKLIDGSVLPLPPQKINGLIEFLDRNEQ